MKSALKDCKDIIDKSSEKLIVQMISNEIKIAGVDILKQWSKELWKNVKYYLNAGFPALDIVLAGYKGGKWISNLVYNTDEVIEKYHNMLAVLEYEKLLNQVYLDLEDTYRQGRTQDNAEKYLSAIDVIFSFKDKDCEKAYGYVNALDEPLVNKLGEFFNGASHYDTLKSQINSLQKVYFTSHEDLSTQWIHYLEEDYPGQGLEEQYEHLFEESRKRILQKKYVIACPVDVYIYDENNALVASVVDNEPFCAGDLTVSVEGDEKEFLFYGNEKYRMECIGNDAGTMDITVKEYEADKEKRNISFYDLPLLDGEKYASDVNTVVSENENYAFILNDSQTVFPNYDTDDLERQRYTVKISSGYITDEDSVLLEKQASVGEKLNLKAVIPDGYVFKGWTSDCEQDIFENSQNEKTVMKMLESDVMVTAMLSKDGNNILATDIVLNESEISLTIGEDYQLSAQVFPEQAENKDVYWGSINENVATVGQDGIVTAVSEGSTQIEVKTQDGKRKAICTVNVTPGGFWISEIPPQTYTGTSIKPIVEVYDGETLLTEKVDYTISYKNNIKVNDASEEKTAPTITVAGKGNYTGKETATFQIQAKDISAEDISADDIVLKYNKKVQKPVLVILRDGKRLGYKKDFIVEYPELENNPDAYKEPGEYAIVVKGIGGYSGERTVTQHITAGTLMSKVSVGKIANHEYTGQPIEPKVTVKCGKDVLTQDEDYSVSYENNTEIGTAKIILIGMGEYTGTKEVTFKIVGGSLNKAKVTGLITMLPYTGEEQYQNCTLTMTINKMPVVLTENEDYVVTYQKNKNAGMATVLFTGINGYSGTIKKSFRIAPFDIKADGLKEKEDRLFEIEQGIIQPYAKGGTKPKPTVTFNGIILEENVDYKLSYKNNTSVNDGNNPHKLPVISVTGKGNFKGVRSESFVIIPQKIDDVTITASDKVYQARKNAWKPTVALTDVDGKRLSAGRDYEKDFIYTYAEDTLLEDGTKRLAGDAVEASDIPIAGTSLSVTALGKGNYTGTVSGIWRIVKSDIAKAKVVIPAQIYTGKEIKPEKDQIELSIGKEKLKAEDYEIISYSNNVKKGSASVVLQGMGNYGGTKTAKFNIKAKGILWWWKELFN